MVREIRIRIEDKYIEIDEGGYIIFQARFKKLLEDDLYYFFIGHLAEGIEECFKWEAKRGFE